MSKGKKRKRSSGLPIQGILYGFWGGTGLLFAILFFSGYRGAFVPALGGALAALLTRGSVTPELRPFFPAYCVGTGMAIWALWSLVASGSLGMIVDLGLLLVGLGAISLAPGLVSVFLLTLLFGGYAGLIWSKRPELGPDQREVVAVELSLLLTTIAGAWIGYLHWWGLSRKRPVQEEI